MAKHGDQPSALVLDELFASQDPSFLASLIRLVDGKRLAAWADRLAADPRPWAREQILAYLDRPIDHRNHRVLVKRLFKHADRANDDGLMAAFMVAFDRDVRRVRGRRFHRDPRTGSCWWEQVLRPGRRRPWWFKARTLQYLRRRAWRYFRRMGHQSPAKYPAAVAAALVRYRDEDLARGENILDSWGLVHALFGKHPLLAFTPSSTNLKPGRDLAELSPAPYFLPLWQSPAAVPVLLGMVAGGRSRLVRVWAMDVLRRQHGRKLPGVDLAALLPLFDHDDEEVQHFAAELLDNLEGLDQVPVESWLKLFRTRSLTALATITTAAARVGLPAKLTFSQAVDLATARALPVAHLGWLALQPRSPTTPDELLATAHLADAKAAVIGAELTAWALGHLAKAYDVNLVARFFDSLTREVRDAAWAWLAESTPAWDDAAFWSRLLETPFDDTRHRLVAALEHRHALPGVSRYDALWTGVLLNVHRGGRYKLTALRQISDALRNDPALAERLLPVLSIAMRSVRLPEARAGVTAIVAALDARPSILPLVQRELPELNLLGEGAVA